MSVPEIDVNTAATRRDAGESVIDVREPAEYEAGHVPGALLIPLSQVPDRFGEVPAGAPVLVICRSGGRSLQAAQFLSEHGIAATNIAGGTMAWIDSGRAVVEGPEPG